MKTALKWIAVFALWLLLVAGTICFVVNGANW